jgi:hypothetical protein
VRRAPARDARDDDRQDGRRRLPPATIRCRAISSRYASSSRTDSTSSDSIRSTSAAIPSSVKNGNGGTAKG